MLLLAEVTRGPSTLAWVTAEPLKRSAYVQAAGRPASLLFGVGLMVCASVAQAVQSGSGWGDLPSIFGQALAVIIYARAVEWIWWLVGATVLAWAFHLLVGRDAGLTHSQPVVKPRNPWRAERDSERLRWLLPFIHLALTWATVLALVVIWLGHRAGIEFRQQAERRTLSSQIAPINQPLGRPWTGASPLRRPWPEHSGYLPTLVLDANKGVGTIVLDNSQGTDSVYAKLCDRSAGPATKKTPPGCLAKRYCFVRQGEVFKLEAVSTGGYEVQFIAIQSGKAQASAYVAFPPKEPVVHHISLFDAKGQSPHRQIPSTDF